MNTGIFQSVEFLSARKVDSNEVFQCGLSAVRRAMNRAAIKIKTNRLNFVV